MQISLRNEEEISKYLETFVPKKRNIKRIFKKILKKKLKNKSVLKFIIYLQKTGIYKKYVTRFLIQNYYIFDISGLYMCSDEEKVKREFCNYDISKAIYSFKNILFDDNFYLFSNNFEYFDDPKSPFLLDLYSVCQQMPQTEDSWTLTLTIPEHLMCLVRNKNFKNLILFKLWYYKIEIEKPDEIFNSFIEIDRLLKTWRKIGFPKKEELLKYKEIIQYKDEEEKYEEGGEEVRVKESGEKEEREGIKEEHKITHHILPPNTSLKNNEENQTSDSEERESKDLYFKRMYMFTPQNERPNVSNEDISRRKSDS